MNDGALTFAKQQLRVSPKENGSKLLGLKWNKVEDSLQVDFPSTPAVLTKRGILAYLAKVYDPLGLLSPMLLRGRFYIEKSVKPKFDGTELFQTILANAGRNGKVHYRDIYRFHVASQPIESRSKKCNCIPSAMPVRRVYTQ